MKNLLVAILIITVIALIVVILVQAKVIDKEKGRAVLKKVWAWMKSKRNKKVDVESFPGK
jgi:hypothetical protein